MTNQRLKLRGHHMEHLAETYFKANNPEIKNSLEYSPIKSSRQYGRHSMEDKLSGYLKNLSPEKNNTPAFLGSEYREFINQELRELEEIILLSPESGIDLHVELTFGPDSICNLCPRNLNCLNQATPANNEDDSRALGEFGLELGKTYTATEIIEKIKTWQLKNNAPSPRQKKGYSTPSSIIPPYSKNI
jgi:hypothetical protein